MVRTCCAVMCGHDGRTCKMKVFPADEERAAVWQMNIGRGDWKRSIHSSVCECHFDEAQFLEPTGDGRRKLRPDAVPLLFPTHVLVIHDPDGDEKWHSPLPANSQPESPDKSTSESQRKKVKRSPECQPAKLTKPMPKSVKAKIEQELSQQASPDKPRLRSHKSAKPVSPEPLSAKPKLKSRKPVEPMSPKPQSANPMPKSAKKAQFATPKILSAKPMPKSVKAKSDEKSFQPAKHQETQSVKRMPRSVEKAQPMTLRPQSAKPMPKSVKAQHTKPMQKSCKANENVESSWPEHPQLPPTTTSVISGNLLSVQLDHDYGQKSFDKMCEKFCSLEDLEEIENQVLHSPYKNSINQSLQNCSSVTTNDATNTDTNLPTSQESVVPPRIIVNPASQSFISPAAGKNIGHETARITRSMKMDTVSVMGGKSSEEITLNANGNATDELFMSTCNGTSENLELQEVSKDVKIDDKSTVYRLGIKRKPHMLLSKRPSKLLKTSQSPSSSKSLLRSPDRQRKTSSPTLFSKSSVSTKDVATETDLPSPSKPPVSSKDVATETVPMSPQKPSVSMKDMATETEPMSPPRLPAQQLQPPEFQVWDTSDGNVALGSPGLLGDTISFLQFMLPEKWMALAENSGIHVVLLSGKTAKAIQRSVFVPFSGKDIELYVHSMKLSNNSAMFSGIRLETRPLTTDSLGDFVDGVVKIVQVFNAHKICSGVAEEEFLQEWRNFHDCILDRNLFGEEGYTQTVRSINCRYLAPKGGDRCLECDIL